LTGPAGATGAVGPIGPAGPVGATGAAGATGPQGPPISFQGTYAAGTSYALGAAVYFNGSSYISLISANKGNQPDINPASWSLLAQQGAQGLPGPTGPQGPAGTNGTNGTNGTAAINDFAFIYTNTTQTINTGGTVAFSIFQPKGGVTGGAAGATVSAAGTYMVDFTTSVTLNFNNAFAIAVNGIEIDGTVHTGLGEITGSGILTLKAGDVVQLLCVGSSPATLGSTAAGVTGNPTLASLRILRIL
jgi:hypothetical protein